jgi:predicted DNA binding CopG/RHH family protein
MINKIRGRPKIAKSARRVRIDLTLSQDAIGKARNDCGKLGLPFSRYIEVLIRTAKGGI